MIDYDSGSGVGGLTIKFGPWTPGAALAAVTTTAADGSFSFTSQPGSYELQIGSDSALDSRTTLIAHVTLQPGSNALAVATPPPQPFVTPDPVQLGGTFRVKSLSSDQQACLTGANQLFASQNAPQYAQDEYIWETMRWKDEQLAANLGPGSAGLPMNQNNGAGMTNMILTLMNAPNSFNARWADGDFAPFKTAQQAGSDEANLIFHSFQTALAGVPWRYGVDCNASLDYGAFSLGMGDPRG